MLLTRAEVAAKLGYSRWFFSRNWRTWRREIGFPGPVVGSRWDDRTLDDWIRARGAEPAKPEPPAPPRGGRPRLLDDDARQRQANRDLDRLP